MAKKVERPVGPVVDPLPVGNVPDMRPLHGRWIRLDHVSAAKHAADLYASFDGKDPEGTYLDLSGLRPLCLAGGVHRMGKGPRGRPRPLVLCLRPPRYG